MHTLKQQAKRWLSGFLALIMVAGLLPTTGLLTPAKAADAPASIELVKALYSGTTTSVPELHPSTAQMRVFNMEVGENEVPGFCADHKANMDTSPHHMKWISGESITTAEGGKYMPAYNLMKAYVADVMLSNYIVEISGIKETPANETKLQEYAHENGYGYYAYQSLWTRQFAASIPQSAAWMCGAGLFTDTSNETQLTNLAKASMRIECGMYHKHDAIDPDNAASVAARVATIKKTIAGELSNPSAQEFYDKIVDMYIYYPENKPGVQPIIVPILEDMPSGGKFGWLKVEKVDKAKNPLPGVTFTVYEDSGCTKVARDQDGNPATFTTDANGYGACEVAWKGSSSTKTFYIKEISAPPDVIMSKGSYGVEVSALTNDTEEHAVLARNMKWPNGEGPDSDESLVKKVDENNNGVGPGTFHFYCLENGTEFDIDFDEGGNLVEKLNWWDPAMDGKYIPEGTYQVTETKGPMGYVIDTHAQELRLWTEMIEGVKTPKNSGPLTFVNYEKIKIVIEKVDESGSPLPGATFDVYYNGAPLTSVTTGPDGSFTLTSDDDGGLPDGEYIFVETNPPAGYMMPANPVHTVFLQASAGGPKTVVISAANYKYPDIVIHKTQTGTTRGLEGAVFEVSIDNVSIGYYGPTGPDGTIVLTYADFGKFLTEGKDSFDIGVREVTPPAGYLIDDPSWHHVTMKLGQEIPPFEFEDEAPTTLIIKKVSANTDEPLAGASFEVEIEGIVLGTLGPTKEDGTIILPYERFGYIFEDETRSQWTVRVREVTPPAGYLISDKSWHTEIVHRGEKIKEFVFKDAKYPEIVIAKKDKETGEYLPNTTFLVKIDGTDFAQQVTTGPDGKRVIKYEEFGEFLTDIDQEGKGWTITVTELKPTDGYNKDKQESSGDYTQTQQLRFDQSVTEFIFEDTSFRKIQVMKLDAKTNWQLKGATFHMKSVTLDDKDAEAYDEYLTTDETGRVTFENLPNGTYHLTEETPPYGYDPEVWWPDGKRGELTIIVSSDDPVLRTFTAKNEPLPGIHIRKIDSISKLPIAGVLFRITPLAPLTGAPVEGTTDANGIINIQDLPVGSYEIEEISAPAPYITSHEKKTISIDNQHDDYTVTFEKFRPSIFLPL